MTQNKKCMGAIRRIITASAVDGPGNRVVVFLQGCQLNCLYCHNPETIPAPGNHIDVQTSVQTDVQTEMRDSIEIQKLKDNDFTGYMWLTPEELVSLIKPYHSFVSGVTISGGECTLQSAFLIELVGALKQAKFNVLIDTNGQISKDAFKTLNEQVDGWIFDAKSLDSEEYKMLTGMALDSQNWWDNLSSAAVQGKLYEVRTVIVPVLLNNYRNVYLMSEWLQLNSPHTRYKLIKFRNHGVIGLLATHPAASTVQVMSLKQLANRIGVSDVLVV